MHYTRHGIIWRAFVWVSWCLLGMACSDHALPTGQLVEEAPRVASLPQPSAPQAGPASADWSAEVQKRMANGERAIRADGADGFRVVNRKQGLSVRFGQDGQASVLPRAGDGGEVRLGLAGVGRSGASLGRMAESMALGACGSDGALDEMGACLKRLEVKRNGVVEWWESRESGLEQGFVIESRPEGRGLLEVDVAVEGAQVEVAGERASEATLRVDERTSWSYAGLHVEDARGKALESWMARSNEGGIRIVVEDEEAVYPVVVDPVLSAAPDWTTEGDQAGAQFGYSVASAGDVNGDGFGDVIVGAYGYDNGQLVDAGRAYVYLGSASGLGTTAAWTAESNQYEAYFGFSVASAGDVNGDGFGDVIVGAPLFSNGEPYEGRAYVYLGSASGLGTTAAWTAESNQVLPFFGDSVASAGDVNHDGFGDVIIGAYYYDNGETDEGRAYVYLGSASGLGTTPAWTAESDQTDARFGDSVASAGDVNGDGFGDVIVGAPFFSNGENREGRAYVYLGSASGLAASAAWTAESDRVGANFGWSVASAGDVNGDGFGDVIVGAPAYDLGLTNHGRAYVYFGNAMGFAASPTTREGMLYEQFGYSVASAGDVNGDGYGDVIVGGPFGVGNDEGRALVYLGSAMGLGTAAAWTVESDEPGASFGWIAAGAGDVNNDGFGDVIVGAPFYDNGQTEEGRAYVYLGSGCGNGLLNDNEACDDGNPVDGDGCDSNCTVTACGNGVVAGSEACDDGDMTNGDGCDSNCTVTACGNGIITNGEGCDDGNTVSGDGCDSTCLLELGQGCATAGVCGSGYCTDGVCCDSACMGLCRACTAQIKGNGNDGECGNVADGMDRDDECAPDPESTCQQDGFCDGNGACRLWASGTSCGSNACAGNVSKLAICDGLGLCLLDPVGIDCGANGCNPATGQCISQCTNHTDCPADAYCDPSGQCQPKAPLGTACTGSAQCQSAHCVDDVCCNDACDGACQACGADGLCGNAAVGTQDIACAPDPLKPCGFIGECTASGACAIAAAGTGTDCKSPSCTTGAATTYACNGQGGCDVATTTPCGDYQCDTTTCKTSCTSNQDCIMGAYCINGQCKPDTSLGMSCNQNDDCLSDRCLDTTLGTKVCCESDCPIDRDNTCGNTGKCAVTGKCEIASSGTSCGAATCTDGYWSGGKACDGLGSCIADPSSQTDCFHYQCAAEPNSCKTSCSSDADCAYSYACRNGICSTNSCETQPCLEGETCDPTTKTCIAATTIAPTCTCQTPGSSGADLRWSITPLALALLMLRRNRSNAFRRGANP